MILLVKEALAEGKKAILCVATAADRARIVWTYRLPREVVCTLDKPCLPGLGLGCFEFAEGENPDPA